MMDAAPAATPGWYPIVGGGKRFWNGVAWTDDVVGAPNATAEYRALDPFFPSPDAQPTLPLTPAAISPRPQQPQRRPVGWYPGPTGVVQWWDGHGWGPYVPQVARPLKEVGIAYLFFLLLGGLGAHRFYLGRTGSAVALLCLWTGGWLLALLLIGIPMIIAGGIWLLVDLFLLPSMVREENARRLGAP